MAVSPWDNSWAGFGLNALRSFSTIKKVFRLKAEHSGKAVRCRGGTPAEVSSACPGLLGSFTAFALLEKNLYVYSKSLLVRRAASTGLTAPRLV